MTSTTEQFAPVALGFTFHPKVSDLRRRGPVVYGKAVALWMLARLHAGREGTGGVIPDVDLRLIYDTPDVTKIARALVDVGLWDEHPRGFVIHDFDTSGGVVLPKERAADPAASKSIARERRRDRNRKYRAMRRTETVSRDAAETPRDASRETPETGTETVLRDAETLLPSQTLPSEIMRSESVDGRETRLGETPETVSRDAPTRTDCSTETGRWAAWSSWRDAAHKLPDGGFRHDLELAWSATEKELARKLGTDAPAAFEAICRAYLAWPDGKPLPGGKAALRGDRPASWLPTGVYQIVEHLLASRAPTSTAAAIADEARRRRESDERARSLPGRARA